MPWQCKLIDPAKIPHDERKPGDMWFAPWMTNSTDLSRQYLRDWQGKRPPIAVITPDGYPFLIDSKYSRSPIGGDGWTVTGEAPNITVSPSINRVGFYHGWLKNGILSDDVEGRKI